VAVLPTGCHCRHNSCGAPFKAEDISLGEMVIAGKWVVGAIMSYRKIVSTILIAAMLFFAPTMIPSMIPAQARLCGVVWLPSDTAFAQGFPCPVAPPAHGAAPPAWFWVAFACPASIILSGIVANFRDNRQLTTAEAWTCGLLYWIPMPVQPQQVRHH
jgi:hypothetical protein